LPVINWRHFTFISADQGDGKEECRHKKARGRRADLKPRALRPSGSRVLDYLGPPWRRVPGRPKGR
jgi:hypothetical protein